MVDIAVPRDIEPQVNELDDVYLYTVDDLRGVIDEGRRSREEAAEAAHEIVEVAAGDFMRQHRALDAVDSIRDFRMRAQAIQSAELERVLLALDNGGDPRQLLEQLARALTNKLIHAPTVNLRKATAEGDLERLRIAREIIGLDDSGEGPAGTR